MTQHLESPIAASANNPSEVVDLAPEAGLSVTERVRLYNFVTLFGIGGTEKQVATLARRLDRSRFQQRFGCLRRWGPLLEDMEREYGQISEYRVHNLYSVHTLRQQLRLARALRRQRIQILHSYNFYANMFSLPAAKLARVPCVVASIRDMGVYLTPRQQYVQKLVSRLADRVVVNAEAIRNWLISQGYSGERITVIPNGVDLARFDGASAGTGLRRKIGVPEDARLVLLLARLNPQKGVEYFLRAAARISARFPKVYFLIVGETFTNTQGVFASDREYPQQLAELATRLGIGERLRITGFVTDIPALLSQVSVSVLPSLSEGLSNTLLESMAAGVPIVATRVGGTPEAIHDGVHGLLVPPKDEVALGEAIAAILGNAQLASQLGQQARERVHQRYSLERMVQANQELYENLVAERCLPRTKAAVH